MERSLGGLCAIPVHIGNTDATSQDLVELRLVEQLRVLRLDGLQLDGDLLAALNVSAKANSSLSLQRWE